MGAVPDRWAARIGPDGARSLRRRLHFNRIGVLIGLVTVAACSISVFAACPDAAAASILGGVPAMVVFFALAIHHLVRAQKDAAAHLGLRSGERKYLPVRDTVGFDRWVTGRERPLWPFSGQWEQL